MWRFTIYYIIIYYTIIVLNTFDKIGHGIEI